MAKYRERTKARELRRKGLSIGDIAKDLNVSRGSVSVWVRDVILSEKQKAFLKKKLIQSGQIGRVRGAEMNKKKKADNIEKLYKEAKIELNKLDKRDLLILAVSLFWAEGSKTGGRFIFVNSDPTMIKTVLIFLKNVLKVSIKDVRLGIQINEVHKPRQKEVLKFWSKYLDLPQEDFDKVYYIKVRPKKVYDNHDSYYGIARLRVLKGSLLQYKFLGYIRALRENIEKMPE
jgi:predicted DNA-binding transcriptional regulator